MSVLDKDLLPITWGLVEAIHLLMFMLLELALPSDPQRGKMDLSCHPSFTAVAFKVQHP